MQPYQVHLALTDRCFALSELNDKVAPFWWESDDERRQYSAKNSIFPLPIFTTEPPPAAPIHPILTVPSIQFLVAAIIQSIDRLFFVSCRFGDNDTREWRLVWVAFMDSMSLYPLCTLDGRFLFGLYICHPADWWYNAINQQYWLQLHSVDDLAFPRFALETHLV